MERGSEKINEEIKKHGEKTGSRSLRTTGKIDGAVWQMITADNLNSTCNSNIQSIERKLRKG